MFCGLSQGEINKQESYFIITPPINLPISLILAREHLKIDISDVPDDYLILLIKAVSEFFENYTGRTLINTGFRTFRNQFDLDFFVLKRSLYQSLQDFAYFDGTSFIAVDGNSFYVDLRNDYSLLKTFCNTSFPLVSFNQNNGIRIDFTAGYGVDDTFIPSEVKVGLLAHLAAMFENRGDCNDCTCEELLPATAKLTYDQLRIRNFTGIPYC